MLADMVGLDFCHLVAIPSMNHAVRTAQEVAVVRCKRHGPVDAVSFHHAQFAAIYQVPDNDLIAVARGQLGSVR